MLTTGNTFSTGDQVTAAKLNSAVNSATLTGSLIPNADDSLDIGSSTYEFKDLYLDGTANIDVLSVTGAVSLNGGALTFNESGADTDARFEGDDDTHLLFLDASEDAAGIGQSAPATKLHVTKDSATNNAVEDVLTVEKTTSGTPAVNIGAGIVVKIEDAGGSEEQASIDFALTDKGDGTEDCDVTFRQNINGTITDTLKLDADGTPSWQGAQLCRIKVGNYTGDGATSQAITGVGFAPKYVRIWARPSSEADTFVMEKVDDTWSTYAMTVCSTGGRSRSQDNAIIALGADGFTVDDGGSDTFPNTNGTTYSYLCLG